MNTLNLEKNKYHENICTVERLQRYIKLTPKEAKEIGRVIKIHPMLISKYYLSLINKKDKNDPIRKIIIPSAGELDVSGSYDTSGEAQNTKMPGFQHKYKQTGFIIATNRCSAYCRHCFRKRLVGLHTDEVLSRFDKAVAYIRKHKEINNVLISGGDPFMLPTKVIGKFIERLQPINHLDFIRFGTRTIVSYPQRISRDRGLIRLFKRHSAKGHRVNVVTHFNHPNEITPSSRKAIDLLQKAGVSVYNQTVLLKGVNDDPTVLADLWTKLLKIEVMPYYMFQCRPVRRVKHHFQVPLIRGIKIFDKAKDSVGGHIMCKRLKFIMSHRTGKIEIIGVIGDKIYFKYHHAKNPKDSGKLFFRKLNKTGAWLDDFKKV